MKKKVFLAGGDKSGWALAQEALQAKKFYQAIDECELVDTLAACDIIHTVWWETLLKMPINVLKEKLVVCSICTRPFDDFSRPQFGLILPYINKVITQSTQATKELESIGIRPVYLPYTLDTEVFRPFSKDEIIRLKQKYHVPLDKYIIGNFHRDSEGGNLNLPKREKGADVLFEIIRNVWQGNKDIHVLLAGPRRHWLRNQLEQYSIPYTFIGEMTDADDWKLNVLDIQTINELYQLLDLAIVSSRCEGAPRTIMEAAATKTKIISTKVGIAEDILREECLFDNFIQAAEIILNDLKQNGLEGTVETHFQTLYQRHTVLALQPVFRKIYSEIASLNVQNSHRDGENDTYLMKTTHQSPTRKITVGLWHKFFKPPYGGGNQFMLALSKCLQQKGVKFIHNKIHRKVDCYLVNSIWFDTEQFLAKSKKQPISLAHRIDGPIQISRGQDKELDDLIYQINQELASFSILQSLYVFTESAKLGYQFINPVVIRNAVDPGIFHKKGRIAFSRERKIKLISTSWSDNPRKGGTVYKWLDEQLDWKRYEYTFVGRTKEQFTHIQHIDPIPSEELADILRQHDIYITASQHDCCSNALIEALACGLPALYIESGGNAEVGDTGGLGFREKEAIPLLLETLVRYYESFQNLIAVQSLDEIADKYLEVMALAANTQRSHLQQFKYRVKQFLSSHNSSRI